MKLMVLDGNSIVNRAFYGIRLLTTKDGLPTNGVYGFLTILQKLLDDEEPDALCVAFDLPEPTFRHEQYEAYKAQRKPMPDDLAVQMPILRETLDAMNIPRYELAGWEADDIIGTIARQCEEAGWECVVVTGDKDSLQLVTEKTRVRHVRTRQGRTETTDYTPAAFSEEYGFEPKRFIDFKALMGDPSDNIPGVPGVGEKTALDLVRRFGGIGDIYGELDALDVKEGVRKKLREGRDAAEMSYRLATICRDVPVDFAPEDNRRRDVSQEALYALFKRLEFTRLMEKFGLKPPAPEGPALAAAAPCTSCEIVSAEDAEEMLQALAGSEWAAVACDGMLETVVLMDGSGGPAYILRRGATDDYTGFLRRAFGPDIKKAGHGVKDIQRGLLELGIQSGGWGFDTALAAYLLSPTDSGYALDRLAAVYCDISLEAGDEGNGQLSLLDDGAQPDRLLKEAGAIAALRPVLAPKLAQLGLDDLYYKVELPLCGVLAEMEHTGFCVDTEALQAYGDELGEKIAGLEAAIHDCAGEAFNINSPKQLGVILFEKLMLPAPKRTKTGYSTNIEVLEFLEGKHPIIALLIEYRELTKLKSTYADGLMRVVSGDGRIHTSFQMTVTATGRLSSVEPNLQNIPVRREAGAALRNMFVADEGCLLVDADYSQIELRILAHVAGDQAMVEAFLSGEDIHTVTASRVFGTPREEVTPLMRSRAKAVNFGIVYGISAFSLARDIGVTVAEARHYMDAYFAKYHGVRAYMHDIVEQAKGDGYVTTLFGRRRYLPELKSSNHNIRAFGERAALNTPIQGTAADIIKMAMLGTYRRLRAEGLAARLILQVHDELIAECPEHEAPLVQKILTQEMERVARLSVPLVAEAHCGKSWSDAK